MADGDARTRIFQVDATQLNRDDLAALRSGVFLVNSGQPSFYAHAMDKSGRVRFDPGCIVEAHLARNSRNRALRVESMLKRARQRWDLEGGAVGLSSYHSSEFSSSYECPVCGNKGTLLGDYVADSHVDYDPEEDFTPMEYLTVHSDGFECAECGLNLDRAEYVEAAGLPSEFDSEREYDPDWDYYGND